ncbi:hypothetical protein F2Q69_00003075 [Brassica cretica]|uniref:Uncharacterized protein n=1 Tax=Brassica cretica TaxID=69181 RepID=A0A8S9NV25_BRACR|nr:hypothetical protein F2Q69_00003075 [Brassica cretica]
MARVVDFFGGDLGFGRVEMKKRPEPTSFPLAETLTVRSSHRLASLVDKINRRRGRGGRRRVVRFREWERGGDELTEFVLETQCTYPTKGTRNKQNQKPLSACGVLICTLSNYTETVIMLDVDLPHH